MTISFEITFFYLNIFLWGLASIKIPLESLLNIYVSAKVWVVVKRLAMVNLLMKGLVMIVGVFRVPYSLSSWIRSPVIRGTRGTSRY